MKKRRSFRTFSYRGVELEKLLDMSNEDFVELVHARARRRFQRGLKRRPMGLIKKLRKAKKEAPPNEKPAVVKTHLRDMIIVPEMIGSVVGIYNGKVFNSVEIKPEMTGHYLAECECCDMSVGVEYFGSDLSRDSLDLLQARQAWSPGYRCYPLLPI
ncbi:ribosomal protein S15 [Ceratobasidium sp. 395]|nr:ribosomal protein S15 [Ceratobasidium sp. 395]